MKKIIALLMMFVISVSMCACSNMSKEEMLAQAVELDRKALIIAEQDNVERAKKQYNGKIVILDSVPVGDIYGNTFDTDYRYQPNSMEFFTHSITVKLSKEDIMSLSENDLVSVVGVLKIKTDGYAELNNAYLIDN